jgi:hypothetical protein
LKIETWSFEERSILLPDWIFPKWMVNRKSIVKWINKHHTKVVSPRSRWHKSFNSTPHEPQNVTRFRMITNLKNFELKLLWLVHFWALKLRGERSAVRANSIHSAHTCNTVITSFLVHRNAQISNMAKKNRCLADPNYFESELPFLSDDI